jgi:chemotaxis protein MotB
MSGPGGGMPEIAHGGEEDEGWLLSFADLVVNMMALFLVLYSISDPDPGKFDTAAKSITEAFTTKEQPPPAPSPFQQLVQQLNQQLAEDGIQVEGDAAQANKRGTTFEFKSGDMFATGAATILPTAEPLLDRVAQNLLFLGIQNYSIDIEGHTDDAPINTPQFPSNWELSSARASAVARFLISRGIKADRISVIGYADTKPKVPNRDPAGNPIPENRTENRRVVVRVER